MWRNHEYPLQTKSHTIIRLQVHLENQHAVFFREDELPDDVLDRDPGTSLTHWMSLNARDSSARAYLYIEIPFYYTHDRSKGWVKRKRCAGDPDRLKVIPRMYFVSPRDAERFYLRLLLLHVRGATDYRSLRTYDGVVYITFQASVLPPYTYYL